jgi:PrcB C-terminal
MMKAAFLFGTLIVAIVLGACVTPVSTIKTVPVQTLFADAQCGGEAPAIFRLDGAQQWKDLRTRIEGRSVGAPSRNLAMPDFSRNDVFVIAMGQRPTLGYSVALASDVARLYDTHIQFSVIWQEPDAGALQGQMLTSPCIVVSTPAGEYGQPIAVDSQGRERVR